MRVYISGMKMPTDNTVLLRIFPASENGECYVQQLDVDGDILTELWAIPVPPHGRLIDADEIPYKKIMLDEDDGEFYYGVTQPYIDRMPTIIEAEEGE